MRRRKSESPKLLEAYKTYEDICNRFHDCKTEEERTALQEETRALIANAPDEYHVSALKTILFCSNCKLDLLPFNFVCFKGYCEA